MFAKKKKPEPVWKDFREKSYEELEQEVDAAYGEEVRKRNIKIAIVSVILIFLFHDVLGFWFRFALPPASKKTDVVVDVAADPVQNNFDDNLIFEYITLEDKEKVNLKKQAEFSITGRVVAKNYLFWGNYLSGGKRTFQSTALFDLGLVWGDLADMKNLKHYVFYSSKNYTGRWLFPTLKLGVKRPPLPWPYTKTHLAHLHIVPANSSIMSALIYSRKYQAVKLDGYLVDVQNKNGVWNKTSLIRSDSGGGACEIMYVNRLQVGKRVYE